jgi:hypothetical protein
MFHGVTADGGTRRPFVAPDWEAATDLGRLRGVVRIAAAAHD